MLSMENKVKFYLQSKRLVHSSVLHTHIYIEFLIEGCCIYNVQLVSPERATAITICACLFI